MWVITSDYWCILVRKYLKSLNDAKTTAIDVLCRRDHHNVLLFSTFRSYRPQTRPSRLRVRLVDIHLRLWALDDILDSYHLVSTSYVLSN